VKGLFYGGGTHVLTAQIIGSAVVTSATFAVAMAVMLAVNKVGLLRVSEDGETYGLDLHEHGISAYPEYVITALGSPRGSRDFPSSHLKEANEMRLAQPASQRQIIDGGRIVN
jgi:Amt family ammonium transporter